MRIKQTIGNTELWQREKTLFLTSRMAPFACYESVFHWVEMFDKQGCAVCFNTSELEEEVLKALLVCKAPTTLVVTGKFLLQRNYGGIVSRLRKLGLNK